ncbi:hypothetical protein AALP_AA6G049500 [Arabis alpina]|uniref:Protein kinase domain-containing protein n=1 Tax=Arabis alpina TaxID=50452 RepID=A0A087GM56_ARAAL|nr:hypothetical protein AALP_AA6G049500 [Arabis alpina]
MCPNVNNLLSILCFALVFSFSYVYVNAQKCGESMFFTPDSPYDTNRRLVLSTLASNVSSRNGYYNVSVGEGPGRIYALGLCIPGTDPKECCNGFMGGSVRKPVCFFRWDGYPYLGAFSVTPSIPPQASQPTPLPPPPPPDGESISTGVIVAIFVSAVIFLALLALGLVIWKRRQPYKTFKPQTDDDMTSSQSLQFDFATIEAATDKFSSENKLGQGGFGEVCKGKLPDGTEIAVKRLSRNSRQGSREFKTEVVIVAKLQHKNLVRLLGFCLEGEEQILVYEFVPNKSLDYFLFGNNQ